jgi:drug/metabolite transporter (DMT)-like permease
MAIVANKFFIINLDPTVFTALRALIIGLGFLLISFLKNGFKVKGFRKVSWKYLLAIGIIGGGMAFLLFFSGLKLTTAGRAAFLHKTLPLYITLFAFLFLKEKVTRKQAGAMLVMFFGTFLILSSQISFEVLLGDILVIGATILWAVENIIAKHVMKKETNWVVTFSRMFFGAVFLFGIMLLMGKAGLLLSITGEQLLYILASTAILFCYVGCWYYSIRWINVSKASSLLLIAPVVSLLLGFLVLNETVQYLQIAGSALILGGAYVIARVKSELLTE